jgi:hypothetical protein
MLFLWVDERRFNLVLGSRGGDFNGVMGGRMEGLLERLFGSGMTDEGGVEEDIEGFLGMGC